MLTAKDHKINRKIRLIKAQISQQEIAKRLTQLNTEHPVSRQAVNNELRGEYKSERIRLGICEIIGEPKETFWPEFYSGKNDVNAISHDANVKEKLQGVN